MAKNINPFMFPFLFTLFLLITVNCYIRYTIRLETATVHAALHCGSLPLVIVFRNLNCLSADWKHGLSW